ncbi:MAG: histidinol dehydrogenase [Conexibacter sp.]
MRLERGLSSAAEVRALVPHGAEVAETVAGILAQVRMEGDLGLDRLRREHDAATGPLHVVAEDLQAALATLDAHVRAALELAIDNVRAVAEAGLDEEREIALPQGQRVLLREVPVARAAVYVPGGRAPYPSTVVMGVVTARVAGVAEVVVCSPSASPTVLAACALAGADEVYRVGGAQAIAALAHGTETIRPVDVIVGPGSLYVQEAKRQVSDRVGIDGFAGPSDLLVVLTADAALAARDLRAQAEHGLGSLVVAASPDARLLDALAAALADAPEQAPCALVQVEDLDAALAFAQDFAPEHLQLIGAEAEALAPRITRAGCLFVGAGAATAFGDYVAGSNHVLPTDGAARFASGLSTRTFRRRMAEVRIDAAAAAALAAPGAAIARAEGFAVHAESMEARIRENGET